MKEDKDASSETIISKPLKSEYACRLKPSANFTSFGRIKRKHDGREYSIIIGGKKKGGSEAQSLRYPKSKWTNAQAKAHCKTKGGSFEKTEVSKDTIVIEPEEEVKKGASGKIPFAKIDEERRLVTGIVYMPDEEDAQEDYTDVEEIEKAMIAYMEGNTQVFGEMHETMDVDVKLVESWQYRALPITEGSWVVTTKIYDDTLWEKIKSGEINGYSMAGTATGIMDEEN